jgi:hypothetical protein
MVDLFRRGKTHLCILYAFLLVLTCPLFTASLQSIFYFLINTFCLITFKWKLMFIILDKSFGLKYCLDWVYFIITLRSNSNFKTFDTYVDICNIHDLREWDNTVHLKNTFWVFIRDWVIKNETDPHPKKKMKIWGTKFINKSKIS